MPQAFGSTPDRLTLFSGEDGDSYTIADQFANVREAYCYECGRSMRPARDRGHYCEVHRQWRCVECGACGSGQQYADYDENYVHQFNWRPAHFMPKGNWRATDGFYQEPLMGVELEVGGRTARHISPVVRRIDNREDHLYMKEDGSIRGVEIVTHPMTLEFARNYQFPELLQGLRSIRCSVDDGYGLHIHVSRKAFELKGKQSSTHQMMWLLFMYRNSGKLEMLARRGENRYAAWTKPRQGELARKARFIGDRYNDTRYVAVNCNNADTFELRFFKATLQEQEFYAALEFADASVRYTRDIRAREVLRGRALTWPHFAEWVERHNYKQLAAELSIREAAAAEAERAHRAHLAERRARTREHERRMRRQQEELLLGRSDIRLYRRWEEAANAASQYPFMNVGDVFINSTADGLWFLTDGLDPLETRSGF